MSSPLWLRSPLACHRAVSPSVVGGGLAADVLQQAASHLQPAIATPLGVSSVGVAQCRGAPPPTTSRGAWQRSGSGSASQRWPAQCPASLSTGAPPPIARGLHASASARELSSSSTTTPRLSTSARFSATPPSSPSLQIASPLRTCRGALTAYSIQQRPQLSPVTRSSSQPAPMVFPRSASSSSLPLQGSAELSRSVLQVGRDSIAATGARVVSPSRSHSCDSKVGAVVVRPRSPRQTPTPVVVVSPFTADPTDPNQLSLCAGDIVDRQYSDANGWAYGRLLTSSSGEVRRSSDGMTFEHNTIIAGWFPASCLSNDSFLCTASGQESCERGRSSGSSFHDAISGKQNEGQASCRGKASDKVSRCHGGKSTASRSNIRARQKGSMLSDRKMSSGDDAAKRWALTARLWTYLDAQEKLCIDQMKSKTMEGTRQQMATKLAVLRDKKAAAARALREVQAQVRSMSPGHEVAVTTESLRVPTPRRQPQKRTSTLAGGDKARSALAPEKESPPSPRKDAIVLTRGAEASSSRSSNAVQAQISPRRMESLGRGVENKSVSTSKEPATSTITRSSSVDAVSQAVRPAVTFGVRRPSPMSPCDSTSSLASAVLHPPPEGMERILDEVSQSTISLATEPPAVDPRDLFGMIGGRLEADFDDDEAELQEAQKALEESLNAVTESGRRVAELRKAWVGSEAGGDRPYDVFDKAEQGGQRLSDVLQLVEDLPGRWQHMGSEEREKLLKLLAGQADEDDAVARAG